MLPASSSSVRPNMRSRTSRPVPGQVCALSSARMLPVNRNEPLNRTYPQTSALDRQLAALWTGSEWYFRPALAVDLAQRDRSLARRRLWASIALKAARNRKDPGPDRSAPGSPNASYRFSGPKQALGTAPQPQKAQHLLGFPDGHGWARTSDLSRVKRRCARLSSGLNCLQMGWLCCRLRGTPFSAYLRCFRLGSAPWSPSRCN